LCRSHSAIYLPLSDGRCLALTPPDGYGDFIALPVAFRPQAERGVPLTSADLQRGALPVPSWIRLR
jgi:hypothetical protein